MRSSIPRRKVLRLYNDPIFPNSSVENTILSKHFNELANISGLLAPTKADKTKNAMAVKDTTTKTAAPLPSVKDTLGQVHFEVIAAKFRKWQKVKAEDEVEGYRSLGLDAKISIDAPGPLLKISVGTYFTLHEADSVRSALINLGKISYKTDPPLQINPKK